MNKHISGLNAIYSKMSFFVDSFMLEFIKFTCHSFFIKDV